MNALTVTRTPAPLALLALLALLGVLSSSCASREEARRELPVLMIDVAGQAIPDDTKIAGRLRVVEDHDGSLMGLDARPSMLEAPIGIELRGQWSLRFPKKSYSLELRDSSGADLARPFLGMPDDSDWVLRAGYFDRTLMRDALGFWLFSSVWGRYASRFRFVEVYVDDDYRGVYLACEKVSRGRHRVDLPKVAPNAASGDITGGYLVHIESNSGDEGFTTKSGREWEYAYPNAAKVTPEQRAYLMDHFDRFEQAMGAASFSDPLLGYARWLDVEAAVDFALFQELAKNTDGYTKSSYYQKLPDSAGGKLITAPIWDSDLAFGNFANGSESPAGWLYAIDWNRPVDWWPRLWSDAAFRRSAACRWKELREGPLTPVAVGAMLAELTVLVERAQKRDGALWRSAERAERRSAYVGVTWRDDVSYLERWVGERMRWLDAQLIEACRP